MPESAEDVQLLLAALRGAVAVPGAADRPGRLRQQIESELGPGDAQRLRRQVHQLVAAVEENLPQDLRRITPLTSHALQRLSQDLAEARGWSPDAAQRVTELWASALGFADLAASSWPRGATPPPPGRPAQETTWLPDAPAGPAPVAAAPAPAPAPTPPPEPAPAPVPSGPVAWPPTPKNLTRHQANLIGEPALGVTLAYAGMDLTLCVVLTVVMTIVLCLPIAIWGTTGFLLPLLGVVGAKVLVGRLGRGALVASESGLELVPYDTGLRTPRPEQAFGAHWSQVSVELGRVSRLDLAGRRVQVGPRNRRFVAAAAARALGER